MKKLPIVDLWHSFIECFLKLKHSISEDLGIKESLPCLTYPMKKTTTFQFNEFKTHFILKILLIVDA